MLQTIRKALGLTVDPAWFEAAKKGDLDAVRAYLAKGTKPDVRDDHDDSALTWAALEGHADVCRVLLEAGANPNQRQYQGATPLMLAADRGRLDVVRLLVEAGADVNARHPRQNDKGALDLAALGGHRQIVEYLQQAGAKWR